ncbi:MULTISPECIES: MFS transporter [unclassified Arthrobacter]|uniref:MFS transporter n=1 Tax=unclassified Arthrobacter TaxID=235627 RepID=UPI000CE2CC7D|nr:MULTISPECIES: MFS transporter [unclassified Arthrobacter]
MNARQRRSKAAGATPPAVPKPSARILAPLYAAGFTTAFGAHSIAAGLGAESGGIGMGMLTLGVLLAIYDVAEVVIKPVFGYLSDRIGAKPIIVAGLFGFALASLLGTTSATPLMLGLARLGQGIAAAAFSPASSAAVARLAGTAAAGSYFGKYGSWKGLGYVLGPLLGAVLIWAGGFRALFLSMAIASAAAAVWVWIAMPALQVLARPRYTVTELVRQSTRRSFLVPTLALASTTGALGASVGFLPLLGNNLHLNLFASIAVVSLLALSSALIQPLVGRLSDQGRITAPAGMGLGLAMIAAGVTLLALLPVPVTLYLAAVVIGCGIGITTPLGFAYLAVTTPEERMGRTMGAAEIGREVGEIGGPLIVGAVATAASVAAGLGMLGLIVAGTSVLCLAFLRNHSQR